jgi:putative sterol carrier protein
MTKPIDILNSMPERFNPDGAGDWETAIQFHLSGDDGGSFKLEVKAGACTVGEGEIDDAKATISMADATFVGINTGTMNPMTAFMTGKIKVKGNMGEIMKLNNPAIFKRG